MNFKSIMLGAAAAGAVATGAQAADLPVAPEPVDYVRVCDAYGTGFFYIPGTDTCLRISGRIRVDAYMNDVASTGDNSWDSRADNGTSTRARAYIYMDSRTNTEYGLLRTYMETYFTQDSGSASQTLNQAYIQFGNFTFGKTQSFYDYYTGSAFGKLDRNWSDHKTWAAAYTAAFGNGLSASVSLEDGTYTDTETTASGDVAGHRYPDLAAHLRVDQGWGSAQIMGALHEARLADGNTDANLGFAVGAGVTYNLPMLAAGDNITFQANYVDGAMKYVNVSDAADIYADGNGKTSTAWNFGGGFTHNWSAKWSTDVDGSWVSVDTPTGFDNDFTRWSVAGNLVWKPVSGLLIGGELQYASTDVDQAADEDDLVATFRVQRTF